MPGEAELMMDLRHIDWDEKMWRRFFRRVKGKVSLVDQGEMGVLSIQNLGDRSVFETQVLVKGYLSEYLDKYRPLQVAVQDVGERRVQLPLVPETESDTYLFYSTRLAMLQANPNTADHLLHFFLNLRLYYNEGYVNFLFLEEDMDKMLVRHNMNYGDMCRKENILNFVRKKLCEGFYIGIHLDEFYMREKDHYGKRHFVHESLIYGFDDESQVFYGYGMTQRQRTAEFMISYEEFLLAYEKGKLFYFCGAEYLEREENYPVILFQIPPWESRDFSEHILVEKLIAFLHPPENERVEEDIHVYGKNVYNWILQDLTGECVRGIVDYRVLHLLYEHKCCIRNRLEILRQRGELSEKGQEVYLKIKMIIDDFQAIRYLYLKQLRKEGKLYSMNKVVESPEIKQRIAQQLKLAITREEGILSELCRTA